jgi:lipoyl(octanoyl) transferase
MSSLPHTALPAASGTLDIYLLGQVDFDALLHLQERLLVGLQERNDDHGVMLLCEHGPLVTIGRDGSRSHLTIDSRDVVAKGLPIRWMNRGGGAVVHTPGQLVVCCLVPVARRGVGLRMFRDALQGAILQSLDDQQVTGVATPDSSSVWCRGGELAQIGAAVRGGVSYFGAFVHVCSPPEWLQVVRPAGDDRRATSIAAQRVRPTSMTSVRESVTSAMASRLGYARTNVFSGHPQLRRGRWSVVYA